MQIKLAPVKANENQISKHDQKTFIKGVEHALNQLEGLKDCKTARELIAKELTTLQLYMSVGKIKK